MNDDGSVTQRSYTKKPPTIHNLPVPSNPEAERAILGGILLDPTLIKQATAIVPLSHFSVQANATIFAAMKALFEQKTVIDLIVLSDRLASAGELERCGGQAYLASLIDGVPFGSCSALVQLEAYASILAEKYAKREAMNFADSYRANASNGSDTTELADFLMKEYRSVLAVSRGGEMEPAKTAMEVAMATLTDGAPAQTGMKTGIEILDYSLGGLAPGAMIVVAGRPSVGKSALVSQICLERVTHGDAVGYVSLEMSKELVLQRMISQLSRVSLHKWRTGFLSHAERSSARSAAESLMSSSLMISDLTSPSISKLASMIGREAKRSNIKLAVVDYLQLVTAHGQNTNEQITNVSHGLQAIARQLGHDTGGCLLVVSQLSRLPGNDEPQLYHLRDSGAIEQDADIVVFLWPSESEGVRVKIGKNRNGPLSHGSLRFNKDCLRFENYGTEGDL